MKNKIMLVIGLALGSSAFANHHEKDGFQLIPAKTLSEWVAKKTPDLKIYDANNAETRKKYGTIPEAVLLTSFDKFDTKKDLPENKASKLVFFCADTKCMASHKAAKRAATSGYKDVYVMTDGIIGWKNAGYPVKALN